jgi:hypothetical protein
MVYLSRKTFSFIIVEHEFVPLLESGYFIIITICIE